jgi:hypothetical protein
MVHFSGLLPRRPTSCFQTGYDAAQSGPSCTFGGKRAKTATPVALAQRYDGVTVAQSPFHSLTLCRGFERNAWFRQPLKPADINSRSHAPWTQQFLLSPCAPQINESMPWHHLTRFRKRHQVLKRMVHERSPRQGQGSWQSAAKIMKVQTLANDWIAAVRCLSAR